MADSSEFQASSPKTQKKRITLPQRKPIGPVAGAYAQTNEGSWTILKWKTYRYCKRGGRWSTPPFSVFLWHAILLVIVAWWPKHIFKCLPWSRAWSTPSLREPDCQTYIFLYTLPFRNNKMLGWDAISFFPPSLCGVRLQAKPFFFLLRTIANIFQTLTLCVRI